MVWPWKTVGRMSKIRVPFYATGDYLVLSLLGTLAGTD